MRRAVGAAHSRPAGARVLSLMMAAGLAIVGMPTLADDPENAAGPVNLFDAEFVVAFGGYFPYVNSEVELAEPGGPGIPVDLEDATGLDQWSATAWVGFSWNYHPRHTFHAEWFQLNRSGQTSLGGSLPIGGSTFFAGVEMNTFFDINIWRLSYGYSMLRDDNDDLKFVGGLHVATVEAGFTGTGLISVNGQPIFNQTHTESSSAISLPLPHLGLSYTRKLSERWSASATFLAFALTVDDLSGHLIELDGSVAYQITDHFGIGGGLKYYNVNVTSRDSDGDAEFNMQFVGPAIFLTGSF